VTLDEFISELLSLPERARKGDFALNLSRGGRLRGERLRKVPREIGSSNVFPPVLSPPKAVRKPETDSDPAKPTSVVRIPSTSLSARIPFIAILSPVWSSWLSRLFQEPGVASVEPGLESGGGSPGSPREDALVLGAHFLLMLLDIAKCRANLARADAE
jgi:hypothetical protein